MSALEDIDQNTVSDETKKREEKLLKSLCSFQSRLGPPEYRRWRRIHGLQFPLHPMQLIGWIVLLASIIGTFLVLVPTITGTARQSLLIVLTTLFSLHVVSHLVALLLDPADPSLRALKIKTAVPEFDRTKHNHVIENGRCHLCNILTNTPKTKHCSVCNKCVDYFDHHCKWLNHCVGGRNYTAFIVCVVSAVLASMVVGALVITELVLYHFNPTILEIPYPDPAFLTVAIALGVVSLITAGLLLHLCLFHCYISFLGITTYEYIRNYRLGKSNKCPSLSRRLFHWKGSSREVGRSLKRQNTDPEFVDRVVKPFVVSVDDEKALPSQGQFTMRDILKLCPKQISLDISRRGSLNGKIRLNQVRPTTEEELNRALDKIAEAAKQNREPILLPLPLLNHPKKLHTSARELEDLRSALDLAELAPARNGRRGFKPYPHTPSLSPIRESGYSNPESPRLPPLTPPFSRPVTPQVSTIFLSNPVTPCSSDEEEAVTPVTYRSPHSVSEDILQTPQMPRKIYSPKQVFVVQSSKLQLPKWSERT